MLRTSFVFGLGVLGLVEVTVEGISTGALGALLLAVVLVLATLSLLLVMVAAPFCWPLGFIELGDFKAILYLSAELVPNCMASDDWFN